MADTNSEAGTAPASEVVMARAGDETAYKVVRAELDAKAAEFPGFVGVEVYPPPAGEDDWTAVLTFKSQTDLHRWRASPERAELLRKVQTVAHDQDWVLPSGFRGWSPTVEAPAWKQAMTALGVLYAMVSVLNITLGNFIGNGLSVEGNKVVSGLGLPFPLVVFIGNAVGTVLLTWVLMPIVTRVLSWWLDPAASRAADHPRRRASPGDLRDRGCVLHLGLPEVRILTADRVAGILLAAGGATRFGSDKLAADLSGRTLLQWSATAMLDAGLDPVLAVVRPGIAPAMPPRVTPVLNEQWHDGIATSVRAGLAALDGDRSVAAAVIAPADQPLCGHQVYHRLRDAFRMSGSSIVIATFDGVMRNPVLLPRGKWTLADQIAGDTGLSSVVRRLRPLTVECGDIGSVVDVDTPADLQRARAALLKADDGG